MYDDFSQAFETKKNRNGFTKLSFLRAYPYLLTQVIMCLCVYKKNIEQSYELRLFMNIEKFQMSFEQNIASNVTRNQESKYSIFFQSDHKKKEIEDQIKK